MRSLLRDDVDNPITTGEIMVFARMLEEPGLLEKEMARLLA